jgi:hypothetical protein
MHILKKNTESFFSGNAFFLILETEEKLMHRQQANM